ncbi:MAG: polysaccharide deacetylase family protein [bacterium]
MYVLITVDTESSKRRGKPLPYEQMVYGRVGEECFGIPKIISICNQYGLGATFFVSVFEAQHYGADLIKKTCLDIAEAGHDVQLHTHPNWIYSDWLMWQYPLERQIELIKRGKEMLCQFLGEPPIAHRAGAFGADFNTLKALAANAIPIDSSFFFGYPYCRLTSPPLSKNGISVISGMQMAASAIRHSPSANGVVEIPPTIFTEIKLGSFKRYRNLDPYTTSLPEMIRVVKQAKERGLKTVVVLLHSFTFLRMDRDRTRFEPDWKDIKKFDQFCAWLKGEPGIEVVTMKQIADLESEIRNPKSAISMSAIRHPKSEIEDDLVPHPGMPYTLMRSFTHFRKSRKNKLVAIFSLSTGLFLLMFLGWLIGFR